MIKIKKTNKPANKPTMAPRPVRSLESIEFAYHKKNYLLGNLKKK